ncbi:hypothetical protein XENORESO_018038 [Xenotaenia resolanae]|uniref:Uncharacterized protein n=1 Tax=Xenotaenia resolanae TaxID=208358 RepID=A0ABV0WT15_9TELE
MAVFSGRTHEKSLILSSPDNQITREDTAGFSSTFQHSGCGPLTDIYPPSPCGFYVGCSACAESAPASFYTVRLLTVKLSKIMSASKSGYKRRHIMTGLQKKIDFRLTLWLRSHCRS